MEGEAYSSGVGRYYRTGVECTFTFYSTGVRHVRSLFFGEGRSFFLLVGPGEKNITVKRRLDPFTEGLSFSTCKTLLCVCQIPGAIQLGQGFIDMG